MTLRGTNFQYKDFGLLKKEKREESAVSLKKKKRRNPNPNGKPPQIYAYLLIIICDRKPVCFGTEV